MMPCTPVPIVTKLTVIAWPSGMPLFPLNGGSLTSVHSGSVQASAVMLTGKAVRSGRKTMSTPLRGLTPERPGRPAESSCTLRKLLPGPLPPSV